MLKRLTIPRTFAPPGTFIYLVIDSDISAVTQQSEQEFHHSNNFSNKSINLVLDVQRESGLAAKGSHDWNVCVDKKLRLIATACDSSSAWIPACPHFRYQRLVEPTFQI
jgi:hypothetical protein